MGKTYGRYVLPDGKTTDDYWYWQEMWSKHEAQPVAK